MNLLILCDEYPPGPHGGIGTTVQVVARNFVRNGHKVVVAGIYSLHYPGEPFSEDEGVLIYRRRIKVKYFRWIWKRIFEYFLIRSLINKYGIDIVEGQDWLGPFAFWPKLTVPLVVRINGSLNYFENELSKPTGWFSKFLERNSIKKADYLIASSHYCASRTRDILRLKRSINGIIYNPIEPVEMFPNFEKREKNKIIFTGTLTPKKGIIQLLLAWQNVLEKCPGLELYIYGKDNTDPAKSVFYTEFNRLPETVKKSIKIMGHIQREKLLDILKTATIGVFPSFSETFGYAAVESMINGCPTIYTKLSCGPEIITDYYDGILINPNCPEEIANAIILLIENERLREQISKNGYINANKRFTADSQIIKNIELYTEMISKK